MPRPIIKISELSNGWIFNSLPYDKDDAGEEEAFTYDDDDENEKSKCVALRNLLWAIIGELRSFSKHNKYNVEARVVNQEGGEEE